jgi:DNA replication and repair protein RecF
MLHRLDLTGFRNYQKARFEPAPGLNLVVGDNGSGKTSLLEAIYVLSTGRSFRPTRPRSLIRDEARQSVLFAQISHQGHPHRLGMERDTSGLKGLRVDGDDARSLGEVARRFPVQVFHPGTVELVEGGPGARRRYLDWGLFHVEHEFLGLHRDFRKVLGQRNSLLKKRTLNPAELSVWDRQVVAASDRIDRLRRAWVARLEPVVNRLLERLGALPPVVLSLDSGWPENQDLAALLEADRQKDMARGFTGRGAHRADLKLTSDAGPVREVFSRGQAKSLAYVLVLAQLELLIQEAGRECLILVDDLGSELDDSHRRAVLGMILELGQQTVFTALNADRSLLEASGQSIRMFHVEHGTLRVDE